MDEKIDYLDVLREVEAVLATDGHYYLPQTDEDTVSVVLSALRHMAARQERQEALERGEAVEVVVHVGCNLAGKLEESVCITSEARPNIAFTAVLRAIVHQPQEVEADVE